MDTVKYIAIYIKCDGFAYPFRVFYKYNNQHIVYNRTFKDMASANLFLKELYEKVEPGFLHYNYTMPKYDAKSKDAYFFSKKNDAIKNAYEYDGLAKPVVDMRPLNRACKKMFGKGLKQNRERIRNVCLDIATLGMSAFIISLPVFFFVRAHKMLKHVEDMEKNTKESELRIEQKLQELEENKTINMMDTIKQNNR